MAHGAMVEEMC